MKFMAMLAVVTALVSSMGCISPAVMTDQELADNVKLASRESVYFGLKFVATKADPAKVSADAQLAKSVIVANVLPVFNGATSGELLRAAVDTTLAQLSTKVSQTLIDVIQFAVNTAEASIKLPANPAAKLDPRTTGALVALFTGINDGIDRFVASLSTLTPAPDTVKIVASVEKSKACTVERVAITWPKR